MKKRILTIMLAATMVASLAGCSGKLSNDKITIKKYKGLEVEVTKLEVTDEDVENSIISTMDAMELGKVKEIREKLNAKGLQTDIQVDGGIYTSNVRDALDAGANVIVAGSAVFKGEPAENVKAFLEIFKDYE